MDDVKELTCQELVELVTQYLEGRLDVPQRARFEQHVAACEGCANYVEQMRRTIDLLCSLTGESLGEPAQRRLLDAFRDWKRGRAAPL